MFMFTFSCVRICLVLSVFLSSGGFHVGQFAKKSRSKRLLVRSFSRVSGSGESFDSVTLSHWVGQTQLLPHSHIKRGATALSLSLSFYSQGPSQCAFLVPMLLTWIWYLFCIICIICINLYQSNLFDHLTLRASCVCLCPQCVGHQHISFRCHRIVLNCSCFFSPCFNFAYFTLHKMFWYIKKTFSNFPYRRCVLTLLSSNFGKHLANGGFFPLKIN